jgi:hypothetical protein
MGACAELRCRPDGGFCMGSQQRYGILTTKKETVFC